MIVGIAVDVLKGSYPRTDAELFGSTYRMLMSVTIYVAIPVLEKIGRQLCITE